MTPTGPTPAREPHQREDEREALVALARVLVEDAGFDHDDASDMAERLLAVWPDERRTVDLTAVAKGIATERQAAHLAARQPARVEAVAKVLAEHDSTRYDSRGTSCWGCGEVLQTRDVTRGEALDSEVLIRRHQAAQIAALAPAEATRTVSAGTHTEWGCIQRRDGAVLPFDNWEDAASWARGPWLSGMPPLVVCREVTDWREVRDAD